MNSSSSLLQDIRTEGPNAITPRMGNTLFAAFLKNSLLVCKLLSFLFGMVSMCYLKLLDGFF